jgi:hypothetical protein
MSTELEHGKSGKTENTRGCEGSKPQGKPRSLGKISISCREHGSHSITAARENSNKSNLSITGEPTGEAIAGKFVSQLIEETESQLAYYESQASILRGRLEELRKLSEINTDQ